MHLIHLRYKHFNIATALRKALGMAEDHGWPRTTRTPPGQHVIPCRASADTEALVTDGDPTCGIPSNDPTADCRHIKIGIRQPRRGSVRSRGRYPVNPTLE
jgi:hypothetical protein